MTPAEIIAAMQVMAYLAEQLQRVSQITANAQAQNRPFTPEEWAMISAPSDLEIAKLTQAIAVAKNPNGNPAPAATVVNTSVLNPVVPIQGR